MVTDNKRILTREQVAELKRDQLAIGRLKSTDLFYSFCDTIEALYKELDQRDKAIAELQDPLTHQFHCRYYEKWARGAESIMNLCSNIERLEKQNAEKDAEIERLRGALEKIEVWPSGSHEWEYAINTPAGIARQTLDG